MYLYPYVQVKNTRTITVLANLTCREIQGHEIIANIYTTLSTLPYLMIIGDIHM